MAIGFFKNIPNIQYDFNSDGKFFRAKDMFRKVSVWSYLQEGVSGYNYYRITEGERPDIVASRLYGDATLYWTFFLVNENLQDLNDWPKSNQVFNKFIDRKYSGTCLIADSSTDIVSSATSKWKLGEKVLQTVTGAYGFITEVNPTHNRITLNSVVGTFTTDSVVTSTRGLNEKTFTVSSVTREQDVINHYIDSNDFRTTVSTGNSPVTNLQHELVINDDKHLIRYIEPKHINTIVNEFKELVRD